jgi:hypothetical protein
MKTRKSWNIGSFFAGAILLGALATLPARAQNYPSLVLSNSPVDYWRFSETTLSPAINTVSNSGSAGVAGTGYVVRAVTGQPGGIVGDCVLFTNTGQAIGNCSSRIDIPNSAAFNPEPPFTIEFWVKPNSPFAPTGDGTPPTGLCPISSLSVSGAPSFEGARSGYIFYVTTGQWEFRVGGLQSYTATALASLTVSTNSWTHVVGEFDGTTAKLYINGVLAASGLATGGPFHPNTFMPTRLGGTTLPGSEYADGNAGYLVGEGNRGWDGWIDEFAVYSNLLSSNTIMTHYTTATNNPAGYHALVLASSPVGYWNLDEPVYTPPSPSYTLAADSGTLDDPGTNTLGSLADQPGVPGTGDKSVFYSGAAGSLVLDTSVAPPNLGGSNITLAAWIKPASFGYVSDIIAQGYDETDYSENFLRVGDSFEWAYFQDNSSGGNYNTNVIPGVDFYEIGAFTGGEPGYVSAVFPAPAGDLGHWVFLVGTYDGANWNLYRNGNLVAQFTDPLALGPATVNHPWSVGSRSNPNPYFGLFFAGTIAEPAILTNALDAGTISNLYNSVALPPVITQAPQAPSVVYEGALAAFSVWADGPGTLSYQWTSNGVAIAGQTATNLTLAGLTASASGTYSVIVTNLYGAVTSSVVLVVTPSLPPVTLVPASETRWLGSPLSFAPESLPNQKLYYQWDLNGNAIGGATDSSYTATTSSNSAGSYTLVISNSYGAATSTVATLSFLTAPNLYVSTILADNPLSYFRLDESNGPTAYDYAGGNNGTYYGNITLGVPGYSLIDPDTAASFPGAAESYVGGIGPTAINFNGTSAEFTIEAWANGAASQNSTYTGAAVVAKGHSSNGTEANEQFAITDDGGFYTFFVRDDKANAVVAKGNSGPDGAWHHLVGVCDEIGGTLTLYIDGAVAGSAGITGLQNGIINSQNAVSIGAESDGPGPDFRLAYNGTISQVAIYATNLSAAQVQAHYAAAYGPNQAPFITIQPLSVTNYVSLPVTLTVSAAGTAPLNYQWNKVGSGPISGATTTALTIANLAYTDAGTYTVGITNTLTGNVVTGIVSAPVTITVLAPPTNPPAIAGLVLHLTFDNNLIDATGRGNNATNEASGQAVTTNNYVPGVIGQAFSYSTYIDSTTTNANYASLGVRPDLQFGSNISFTVSMWVQLPVDYIGNDLPFFTDAVGSTYGKGYVFAPTFGTTVGSTTGVPGGWAYSIFDAPQASSGNGAGIYGAEGSINDGNWHSLVYVIDRKKGGTVYLDGTNAPSTVNGGTTITAAGDIDTTNSATIGQDPTGLYNLEEPTINAAQSASAYIDDLGVWRRALTPLEAASIYMAGISNQVSFTGASATLSINVMSSSQLQLTYPGSLQSATNLSGPWSSVPGATSPFTVSPTGANMFFRAKL